MNKMFLRFVSAATSIALLFSTSSGSLKTIVDNVSVKAADVRLTGDISGNGKVDVFDLIRIKNETLNPSDLSDCSVMDLSGDSIVDNYDVKELQHYL